MELTYYISAIIAILASIMVITSYSAIYAVLYLIVSLLALAIIFYLLGAPFAAALEVIIYAGAIMILFVFAIMLLNVNEQAKLQEQQWLNRYAWTGPLILSTLLLIEMIYLVTRQTPSVAENQIIDAKAVGISLFGPYLLAVEIASLLLLAGLVGAYHLGRRIRAADSTEVN